MGTDEASPGVRDCCRNIAITLIDPDELASREVAELVPISLSAS